MIQFLDAFGIRFLAIFLVILVIPASAQESPRSMVARKTTDKISVDGNLSEPAWIGAQPANDFVQNSPIPGFPSRFQTEVKIVYNDDAIFVGARMYDSAPDSILHQLSNRDALDNTDTFGFWISCFRDGINAFYFAVTPDGVQYDAQLSTFGEDEGWNAVWQCNTAIDEHGWTAEFKIPYSALRFPEAEDQVWDINFNRNIRRFREISFWNEVDPAIDGQVNQSGVVLGISNIKPPVRFFLSPFVTGYLTSILPHESPTINALSYTAGMDLKYGINEAFTLDMTLIPDFGQVQSDNNVLNLTPFEVFFEEQRQFFKEGTELFSKGDLFYTRRIGALRTSYLATDIQADETIYNSPQSAQLLNATKISGRGRSGLGVGVLNATSAATYATALNSELEPRQIKIAGARNYNVTVLDQNLGANSFVSLINTNVLHFEEGYMANVTGTAFDIRSVSNSISFSGDAAFSQQRLNSKLLKSGFRHNLSLQKVKGNFTFGGSHSLTEKTFDPNDLGFQTINNVADATLNLGYRIFKPFLNYFNSMWSELSVNHQKLVAPSSFMGLNMAGEVGITTKKFTTYFAEFSSDLVQRSDFFEPRVEGRKFVIPRFINYGGWVSTDYRKKLALDIGIWHTLYDDHIWNYTYWRISPRWRVNDHLMFIYVISQGNNTQELGFAGFDDQGETLIGRRNVLTNTQVLTANYIFNNRMGLSLRLRHYTSSANYQQMNKLIDDGSLSQVNLVQPLSDFDRNYSSFNLDMIYTWVFSPGSEIRVVWKHFIQSNKNISDSQLENFQGLFTETENRSISIRFAYFIDYLNIKRKEKFIEN